MLLPAVHQVSAAVPPGPQPTLPDFATQKETLREADPTGRGAHDAGAKLDQGKDRVGLVLGDFSRALRAVSEVGTFGANKYTDHGWITVPNGVARYTDAMQRHWLDEFAKGPVDADSGCLHAAQVAWNALARLELMLRGPQE